MTSNPVVAIDVVLALCSRSQITRGDSCGGKLEPLTLNDEISVNIDLGLEDGPADDSTPVDGSEGAICGRGSTVVWVL